MNKATLTIVIVISLAVLICGVAIVWTNPNPSVWEKLLGLVLVQGGGACFFGITIGQIAHKVRTAESGKILWDYVHACQQAGVVGFYGDRKAEAEVVLAQRFDNHRDGDILICGASLRAFFATESPFYGTIAKNIERYASRGVHIRAVWCDKSQGQPLPMRSFVEEFNPDGTHPRGARRRQFKWESGPAPDLLNFCTQFYEDLPSNRNYYRCVQDLEASETGVHELNAQAKVISVRTTTCSPYFTAVIFPDKAFYTPNILYCHAPANMPMTVFLNGGPVYDKLLWHFQFIWWSGKTLIQP